MQLLDDLTFTRTLRDGKPWWLASNGRWIPDIRGGADDGGGDDDEGEGDEGDDAGDDDLGAGGGDDKGPTFDEARARAAITKRNNENRTLRNRLKEAEKAEARLKELEDKDKSESQRLLEERDSFKNESTSTKGQLLRLEVALDKAPEGMSLKKVRQLAKRLSGSTQEELEADADELFAEFTSQEDTSQEDKTETRRPGSRPKEKLRAGAVSNAEHEETDPQKLAEMVPRR